MATRTEGIPWTQKYRPKTLAQVVGNKEAVDKVLAWLKRFNAGKAKKAALLSGPPGTGKTVTAEAVANDLNYVLVETNASDFRTADQIEKVVAKGAGCQTLDQVFGAGAGKLVLFDEVDGISGQGDRGGVGAIIKVIKETSSPVLLTANDLYSPRLRELRQYCYEVNFKKLDENAVAAYLSKICESEGIQADLESLLTITRNVDGDLRAAINSLQALAEGKKTLRPEDIILYRRDEQVQVYEALKRFFAAKTWAEARRAVEETNTEPETMMLCIHESLPYQLKDPHDLAKAYQLLAQASAYLGTSQRERTWQLMRYFFDLMNAIPFTRTSGLPTDNVRFSMKLVEMSRSRTERALRKEMGLLVGGKLHVSSAAAIREVLPYICIIFDEDPEAAAHLSKGLELQENMVEYLSPKNAGKIIKLMEQDA